MLDQNTDRMWFVIGAVIVGAAIIFIANGTLPTLFASVADTFNEATDKANDAVLGGFLITPDEIEASARARIIDYDQKTNTWTLKIMQSTSNYSDGLQFASERNVVPHGKRTTLSYEVLSPVDAEAVTDINNYVVDGTPFRAISANDNDLMEMRRFNGLQADINEHGELFAPFMSLPVQANTWTTISYSFVNDHPENTEKVALEDRSRFGVKNTDHEDLEIQIRNIRWTVSDL